ncbi:MAG TPA: hypothetical protein VN284_10110, partial [Rhizobium sp.]|nr:hypothetical protein [Rhizobium sp.]
NLKMIPNPSGQKFFLAAVDKLWTSLRQINLFHIVHRACRKRSAKFEMWIKGHVFPCREQPCRLSSVSSSLFNRQWKIAWRTERTSFICI